MSSLAPATPLPDLGRPFMCTRSGQRVHLDAPDPASIRLGDIAHALGALCRYCGHTPRHYSVAEHSLLVAALLPPPLRLHGLLHDAAEAFFGDVIAPVKRLAGYELHALEKRLMLAVYDALELPVHYRERGWILPRRSVEAVRDADRTAASAECAQLGIPWPGAPPIPAGFEQPIAFLASEEASHRWELATRNALLDDSARRRGDRVWSDPEEPR